MDEKSIRIVVVDDHTLFREGVRRILDDEPDLACVGQAATPAEAVALIDHERPDLVLLDLRLAGCLGIDLLPRLLAMPWAPQVLIVTAFPDEAMITDAIRLGARGVVLKDADPDTLRSAIRTVADGELWFPAELALRVITALIPAGLGERLSRLTAREREIAALVGQGLKNREISERLVITERDTQAYLVSIFEKLGVEDRLELALLAIRLGLVSPPGLS
ncbi:MAG TPA: response regulator transcription factor [Methylomirabilota bacterium]|nr:response regulator transcription factor [Methylomirabilota bacterium]